MVTGRKGSFSRTPKVADRTFVPPYAFLFNCFMLALMSVYVVQGLLAREYLGTIIPAANVTLYLYGLHRFVGFRNGFADIVLAVAHALWPVGPVRQECSRRIAWRRGGACSRCGRAFSAVHFGAVALQRDTANVRPGPTGRDASGRVRFGGIAVKGRIAPDAAARLGVASCSSNRRIGYRLQLAIIWKDALAVAIQGRSGQICWRGRRWLSCRS